MACIARVVAPGLPHHITQRGNRRQETVFCAEDYQAYIGRMREWRGRTTRSARGRRAWRWWAIGWTVSPRAPRRTRSGHSAEESPGRSGARWHK